MLLETADEIFLEVQVTNDGKIINQEKKDSEEDSEKNSEEDSERDSEEDD